MDMHISSVELKHKIQLFLYHCVKRDVRLILTLGVTRDLNTQTWWNSVQELSRVSYHIILNQAKFVLLILFLPQFYKHKWIYYFITFNYHFRSNQWHHFLAFRRNEIWYGGSNMEDQCGLFNGAITYKQILGKLNLERLTVGLGLTVLVCGVIWGLWTKGHKFSKVCKEIHEEFTTWYVWELNASLNVIIFLINLLSFKIHSSLLAERSSPFPGSKTFDVVISAPSSLGSRWDAGAQPNSPSRSTSHQPNRENKQEN